MPGTPTEPVGAPPRRRLDGYRDLLASPSFGRLASVGLASKLPAGMVGLGLLLLVGRDHGYGTAGLAVSGSALGQALTAPLRGRLVDRCAPRPVLLGSLAAHLATVTALVTVARGHASVAVLLVLAVALGVTTPPVAVMMRSAWHGAAGPRTAGTAMALDSAMTGTALITGPLLASWLSLSVSPVAPFVAVALLISGAVALLVGVVGPPCVPPRPAGAGRLLGPLTCASLRRLLAVDALFVASVTGIDVLLPVYAQEYGAAAYAGLYLGALSIGSVLGSLALGALPSGRSGGPGLGALLGVFAAGAGALAVACWVSPTVVLLVCPVAGLAIGSAFGALRTIAGDLAPRGRVTETMSWLSSLDLAGGAAGAALFAYLADAEGSRTTLLFVPAVVTPVALLGGRVGARSKHSSATPRPSTAPPHAP
ncbi:MFS transporter [Streptomyces sp. NPDC087300]|uniref:MFS transporter n=1 Tax=Streptomyces sp. NPDC087300 TaxID=3365780 RepID=UPI003819F1AB